MARADEKIDREMERAERKEDHDGYGHGRGHDK
jgi:hypothetical protein